MQENKFEKGVQQQVEGLRIRPSEAVWEKVEEELRKKKKRRVVFFIFLLAGLSVIGGFSGYFIFNNSKPNLVQQNTSLPDNGQPGKNNEPQPGNENSKLKAKQDKKEDQLVFEKAKTITTKENVNSTETSDIILNKEEKINKENSVIKKEEGRIIKKTSDKPLLAETINKDNVNDNVDVSKNSLQARDKAARQKEDADIPVISKTDISQPVAAENNLVEEIQLPVANETIQSEKDSAAEKVAANNETIPVATKKKKWVSKINWGFDLAAGIAGASEDLFSFSDGRQKSLTADYLSSPSNNAIYVSPGIVYSPSSIQSGPAFRVGLIAEMKITPKSNISSGLRYAYFSNTIQVGTRNTSVALNTAAQSGRISSFYRGFPEKEYTNRYHFIQLPVQYQLQLNKGVKLPVSWDIGASVGYLFATNGLVYDAVAGGVYYRNNDAFNKIRFNLNTGFSFRFGNKKKIQWSLGPELSLGMNKLMKDDYTNKQYLLYGGMTGRIIFSKKNK